MNVMSSSLSPYPSGWPQWTQLICRGKHLLHSPLFIITPHNNTGAVKCRISLCLGTRIACWQHTDTAARLLRDLQTSEGGVWVEQEVGVENRWPGERWKRVCVFSERSLSVEGAATDHRTVQRRMNNWSFGCARLLFWSTAAFCLKPVWSDRQVWCEENQKSF